jgi:hypothetical protein
VGIAFVIALSILSAPLQTAHEPNDNAGILSGPGFAFILAAPDGWVLDDVSGRKEGLPAVFYKRGDSWSHAKVVMYANPVRKSKGETVGSVIADDVSRFRSRNPGIAVEDGDPVAVNGRRKLPVKVSRGTRAGDTEIVAYADESGCVVMIVLSGTADDVHEARASFAALLRTYTFITADVRE